tara:strand:- start:795 stop:911 length:117 start_codon:yes stop_codon:yes gene_type:complete
MGSENTTLAEFAFVPAVTQARAGWFRAGSRLMQRYFVL